MLSLFLATCGQRWYPKLGREAKDDLPFVSWWLFKPQPYAIRHSKVDKCFGRVRVAYWSTFAQERCTIVECCLVAALVELRSGGVLPKHTDKKGWTSTYYTISTGAIIMLYYIHWCLQSNIADGDVSRGVQYEFDRICRQQNRDGQVISTCNSSHVWESFIFFGPSLNWGTESKPFPQFGVRCVESVTRWIRLFGEISNSHASLKWRTFIIDA